MPSSEDRKEARKAYMRNWIANNKERVKKYKAKAYNNNKEKNNERSRRWRIKNRERERELQKKWRENNLDKIKDKNLRRVGASLEKLNAALIEQDNKCALCDVDLTTLIARHTHMDHCHLTMKPRAVLCHSCNTGIGSLKDSPDLLQKAINYILYWRDRHNEKGSE